MSKRKETEVLWEMGMEIFSDIMLNYKKFSIKLQSLNDLILVLVITN